MKPQEKRELAIKQRNEKLLLEKSPKKRASLQATYIKEDMDECKKMLPEDKELYKVTFEMARHISRLAKCFSDIWYAFDDGYEYGEKVTFGKEVKSFLRELSVTYKKGHEVCAELSRKELVEETEIEKLLLEEYHFTESKTEQGYTVIEYARPLNHINARTKEYSEENHMMKECYRQQIKEKPATERLRNVTVVLEHHYDNSTLTQYHRDTSNYYIGTIINLITSSHLMDDTAELMNIYQTCIKDTRDFTRIILIPTEDFHAGRW